MTAQAPDYRPVWHGKQARKERDALIKAHIKQTEQEVCCVQKHELVAIRLPH